MSGASGVLGSALAASLGRDGHEVRRLVRRPPRAAAEFEWDPLAGRLDGGAFEGVDTVVNLSGAGIADKRWTETRKKIVYESRIGPTRLLAEVMAGVDHPPASFVSQSAMGIYGDQADTVLTEASELRAEGDFGAELTADWEAAAGPARDVGIRVVHPRTSLVLVAGTQLLGRLVPLFKAGLGGPISDGRQWWSWIAIDDQVQVMHHLITTDISGPVNVATPNPVHNRDFARLLGDVLGRPAAFRVPRFALRVVMGSEAAESIGWSSIRLDATRLVDSGFEFTYPELTGALQHLLK